MLLDLLLILPPSLLRDEDLDLLLELLLSLLLFLLLLLLRDLFLRSLLPESLLTLSEPLCFFSRLMGDLERLFDTLFDLEGLLDTVGDLLTDFALGLGDAFFFTGVASFFLLTFEVLTLDVELTFDEDLEEA